MSVRRSHTLYLQSKHRTTGTPSQYTITLPNIIDSDPNLELFRVTLVSFTTYNDFLQVKEGKDTIKMNGTDYTIPHGTYTFQKLSKTLQNLLGINVFWNVELNAITFAFDTTTSLVFDGIAYILGFDEETTYTGTQITSVRAMKPYKPSHIFIHLNNVSTVSEHLNLSNHGGEVRLANVLAKVLINANPFQLISYNQILDNEGLYTGDTTLQTLELMLTDNDGNEFVEIGDHEMVLRIESLDIQDYDMKAMITELKEIRQTLKDTMLIKALRFRS